MIIAIDGPVASGKGTLAKRLSLELEYSHLDTGTLYRAVAASLLRNNNNPTNERAAIEASKNLSPADLNASNLRDEEVGHAASIVSQMVPVRRSLLIYQRNFANNPPNGALGVVLDGRDIGTIVCPNANIKLFITATSAERARRRWSELRARGIPIKLKSVRDSLVERDKRDLNREASPLRPAKDAHLIDTTNLDIDAAFEYAMNIVSRTIFAEQ